MVDRYSMARGRTKAAFTLIELLIVVAIIAVLIALIMPTYGLIHDLLVRMHCAANLRQCHSVLFEYATHYGGILPPFSGGDGYEVIQEPGNLAAEPFNMPIPVKEGENPFMMVELLKSFGGGPHVFFCPAHSDYNRNGSNWKAWYKTSYPYDQTKQVRTSGYMFFIRTWQYHGTGTNRNRDRYHCGTTDGRILPRSTDEPGTIPLAADMMVWQENPWTPGNNWQGFNHHRDHNTSEGGGGGGHTLFLNGSVQWKDWDALYNENLDAVDEGLYPDPWFWPNMSWARKVFCQRYPESSN